MNDVLPNETAKAGADTTSAVPQEANFVDPIIELYMKDVDRSL